MEALNVPRLGFDDGITQDVGSGKTLTESGEERAVFPFWVCGVVDFLDRIPRTGSVALLIRNFWKLLSRT